MDIIGVVLSGTGLVVSVLALWKSANAKSAVDEAVAKQKLIRGLVEIERLLGLSERAADSKKVLMRSLPELRHLMGGMKHLALLGEDERRWFARALRRSQVIYSLDKRSRSWLAALVERCHDVRGRILSNL